MRVYPAWDIVQSKQAKQTQAWQLPYFFEAGDQSRESSLTSLFNDLLNQQVSG